MKYRFALLDNFLRKQERGFSGGINKFLGKLTAEAEKTLNLVIEIDPRGLIKLV